MVFEEIATIAQATAAGLGLSLLPRFLIERELERGELAIALDRPLRSSFGYYLVINFGRSLGHAGTLPPVAAAWSGNVSAGS